MEAKEAVSTKTKSGKKSILSSVALPAVFSKVKKEALVILLVVVLLAGGGVYLFKNQLIVARVNGQSISRLALIRELEKQAGKSVLESLITKTLILQEAKKEKATVSDDEIDQEMKRLEESLVSQGQDLNQALSLQGITQSELREQIRIQKMIEKIVGGEVEVTDQEVEDSFEVNKDSFPEGGDEEGIKTSLRQQLRQQKLSEKIQLWLKALRDDAQVDYLLKF